MILEKNLAAAEYLSLLRRTQIGDFNVDDALDLDEFTSKFNVNQN